METCSSGTPPPEELRPPNEEPPRDTYDHFSNLPDDLIASVLGFLPAKEAARTSALSTGWRLLWTSAPCLDFCPPPAEAKAAAQPDAVDHVLRCHGGPLSRCRLLFDPPEKCLPRLGSWVARLAEKRIQRLDLRGLTAAKRRRLARVPEQQLPRALTLPPRAFAIAADSLRHLSLSCFRLPNSDWLLGCGPNLTSLHLSYISFMKDDQLSEILGRCPRLEKLSLSACPALVRPAISSPALRDLALSHLCLDAVLVDAPALMTLTVSAVVCSEGGLDLQAPRLEALNTFSTDGDEDDHDDRRRELWRCRCTKDVLEHFSNIMDRPSFDVSRSPFGSLRRLAVHVNLNDLRQVVVLRFMLMSCEALQEVTIKNGEVAISDENQHSLLPYSRTELWQRPDYNECLKNFCGTLRELSLTGCRGEDPEWEFLAFLVSNAQAMSRLEIWCCAECGPTQRAVMRKLLSTMKRASAELVVTFHGQRVDPS